MAVKIPQIQKHLENIERELAELRKLTFSNKQHKLNTGDLR